MDKQNQFEPVEIKSAIVNDIDRFDLKEVEYDTLVQMGIEVSEVKIYTQWILGKLGDAVTQKYGDLAKYAKEIRQKYEVLQQYMNTYRKFIKEDPTFTPKKYYGSVPWGMLQLAAIKSDTPQQLVDQLTDEGVQTIEGAYKKIKEEETGEKIPHRPKLNLFWDETAKKYKIKLKFEELDLIDWTDVKEQLLNYLEGLK